MNLTNHSTSVRLCAAGLFLAALAYPALAGYKVRSLGTNGIGVVEAWLAYGKTTNSAISPNAFQPNAGVTDKGSWMTKVPQPAGTPLVCTSTVSVVRLTGGYFAVGRARVATGVTADNDELSKELKNRGFELTPALCGATYDLASGEEIIDGVRYLIVLGTATEGTAAWFRGYSYDGSFPPTDANVLAGGTKLFDVIVKGPVDFGDPNSEDRCKAMKIPIPYNGPNLYLFADGLAESETDLEFVEPPTVVELGCSATGYPQFATLGGCGNVTLTFSPAFNQLPPGATTVMVVATDSADNYVTHQFVAQRPLLTFTGFYSPINGTGGGLTECGPIRFINAGNKIPVKFDTTFCGVPFQSSTPPTITITRIDKTTCAPLAVTIDHAFFQWVANQWHFNWNTVKGNAGNRYRIEVELGDGSANPFAIVELQ